MWAEPCGSAAHGRELAGAAPRIPPVRGEWVQRLTNQIPAQTFPVGLDRGSAHASSGHVQCRRWPRCLCSPGSSTTRLDSLFLYMCFSLPPKDKTKPRKHSTLQASSRPHLQMERCLSGSHKHGLSHTLGAVSQLYHKSYIPLLWFQLPFSATRFSIIGQHASQEGLHPPQNIILTTSDH